MRRAAPRRGAQPFERPAVGDHEVGLLPFDREARRHHADHGALPAVRGQRRAEHVGAAAEPRLPELVAEHHDGVVAAAGPRRPCKSGRAAAATPSAANTSADAARPATSSGWPLSIMFSRDGPTMPRCSKDLYSALATRRSWPAPITLRGRLRRGVVLPDRHDAIGVAIGQRLEHDAANDAEDGGGGADAQRQREHRRNGESRRAQKGAEGEAQVLDQVGHQEDSRPSVTGLMARRGQGLEQYQLSTKGHQITKARKHENI